MVRDLSVDIKAEMLRRVAASPANIWTPVDFLDIGARAAVDKALQRMVQANQLRRLDRGFYFRGGNDDRTEAGPAPTLQALIDAISRRDQTRLLMDERTAANDLGLTDEVPDSVTILSDARLRPIRFGNRKIVFKQAAPSKLHWAGHPAMHIVQALHGMHEAILAGDAGTATRRIRDMLGDPDRGSELRDDLRDGLPTLPIWMQTYLRDILDKADPMGKLPLGRPAKRQSRSSDSSGESRSSKYRTG